MNTQSTFTKVGLSKVTKEKCYLHYISKLTNTDNMDNISRTKAYQTYYFENPEIKWALLASIVSRNAGWNMTDLHIPAFKTILGEKERTRLFMTYERANWLIFSDAYPQLLIYKLSKRNRKALFHLLKHFHVSSFMIREWYQFWETKDQNRLMTALIINEQNVIENPVIQQHFFKKQVFHRIPYLIQDTFLMSAVLIPTKSYGLNGIFVKDFTKVTKRITTGKKIAKILFSNKINQELIDFIANVEHTASRRDYEKYLHIPTSTSPMLRLVYPIISHQDNIRKDWYKIGGVKSKWFHHQPKIKECTIGKSFYNKRKMLETYASLKKTLRKKDLF